MEKGFSCLFQHTSVLAGIPVLETVLCGLVNPNGREMGSIEGWGVGEVLVHFVNNKKRKEKEQFSFTGKRAAL